MAHPQFDYSHLSPEERLQLVEDLWDSLVREHPAAIPVPASHLAEIERRLAAYRADGQRGRPWREALDEIDRQLAARGDPAPAEGSQTEERGE
jgi:putative addiction module component (TIGR02574 family)